MLLHYRETVTCCNAGSQVQEQPKEIATLGAKTSPGPWSLESLKEGFVGVVVGMGNSGEELLFTVLLAVANAVPVTSCPPEEATVVWVFPAGSSSSSVTCSSVGFPHLATKLRAEPEPKAGF